MSLGTKPVVDMKKTEGFGLNESYVEILRAQWIENPLSVGKEWRDYFENKSDVDRPARMAEVRLHTEVLEPLEEVKEAKTTEESQVPLTGIQRKIAENMAESLLVPTATSVRTIPVKVLEENRLVINQFLLDDARPRCSFTHIIAYA